MFITVEGIEGSGKTCLLEKLEQCLSAAKVDYLKTREPGSSWLGTALRPLLLQSGNQLEPAAELFMFLADRAQHVAEVIRPALAKGQVVLCDRYIDSTMAYQGYGRNLNRSLLADLNKLASSNLVPDLTLLLDLPAEQGLTRARLRNAQTDLEEAEGRFEDEQLDFHRRVRQGFLELAAANPRFVVLDAQCAKTKLADLAWQAVLAKNPQLGQA